MLGVPKRGLVVMSPKTLCLLYVSRFSCAVADLVLFKTILAFSYLLRGMAWRPYEQDKGQTHPRYVKSGLQKMHLVD